MIYRPYQINAIQAAIALILMGKRRLILLSPTGSGKTVMAAMLVLRAIAKGKRVLFLAHRRELIEQTVDKLVAAGVLNFGVIMAGNRLNNANAPVQVASIQTLIRRELPPADLILVDECHRAAARQYQAIIANYPKAVVIGLTATPERTDGKGLDDLFDDMVVVETVPNLIEQGYLVKPTCYVGPTADLSGVRTKRGDYDEQQLAEAMDKPKLTGDIIANWKRLASGKQTVAFAVNVAHAEHIAAEFRAAGVSAAMVSGETPRAQREAIIADWRAGYIQVVANALIFTEGFDYPGLECCILARPTQSISMYLQCLDAQTEILTRRGFVGPDEIRDDDEVASFRTDDGAISFGPILSRVDREIGADEEMYSLQSPSLDIRVTGGHRMVFKTRRFRGLGKSGWKIDTAQQLSRRKTGWDIPVAGIESAPGLPLSDDEIRFIGWFLTDGSLNKVTNAISIYQAEHQPWREEIDKMLRGCGFKYSVHVRWPDGPYKASSRRFQYIISKGSPRVSDKHLSGWARLEPYIDKSLSPALEGIDSRQLAILLEAIHLGDGSKQAGQTWTRRSYHITTGNEVFANRLQSLCVRRGWRCNIYQDAKRLFTIHIKDESDRHVGGCAQNDRSSLSICSHEPGERVWCVETKDGTLITRRNGKVSILGNCVGRVMRPAPGKTGALILDHAGCCQLHGPPHIDREWTLEGMAKKRKDKKDEAGNLKVCHVCGMAYESEPKLWLAEVQPSLREAFNPVATQILRGKAADRGMDTCPGCGTASCLTCNDSFVPKLGRRDIDGIAWENLASCPSCHAHYVDDVPHLITEPTETEIPDTTNDQLVAMDESAIPTKVIVMNDYKKLLNEARQKGRKRGWAWHKLKDKYDESTLRECLPRHTADWWRAQA